jgi:hypothetical protein
MFEPGFTEKVVNYCSGVAYSYRDVVDKPETVSVIDGPAIGDRAPDVDFDHGGTLFDRLRHQYFTLLVMPDGGDFGPTVKALKRRFSPVLEVETLPRSEALSKRYGASDGRFFLVRPDGYIGFRGKANEVELLEAHLGRMLRLHTN